MPSYGLKAYDCSPGAAVGCPLTVLCGDADPACAVSEADAWRPHTTGAFGVSVYPGGHFSLDAQAAGVAAEITGALTGQSARACPPGRRGSRCAPPTGGTYRTRPSACSSAMADDQGEQR